MSLYATAVKKPVTTALVFVAVVIMGLFRRLAAGERDQPDHGHDGLSRSQCHRY